MLMACSMRETSTADMGFVPEMLRDEIDWRLLDKYDCDERPDSTEDGGDVDCGVEISELLLEAQDAIARKRALSAERCQFEIYSVLDGKSMDFRCRIEHLVRRAWSNCGYCRSRRFHQDEAGETVTWLPAVSPCVSSRHCS